MSILRKSDIKWSSERAFVLATIAAAVGLGNIWRFPYIAGENGGAAFIFAYILSIIFIGIPIMILEIGSGRAEQGGPVVTFKKIWKSAEPFGWFVVFLTLIIMSYYLVITGWTLGYAVDSYFGSVKSFDDFTDGFASLYYFFIVSAITGFIVFVGTQAIEWLSKIFIPLLFVVLLLLLLISLNLPGRDAALSFLFSPDLSALSSPKIWLLAIGQAFYSLAIGQGYLITYGRFLKKEVNLVRSTSIIAPVETLVAILSGIIIFPIVFTFGINPAQGTELAFVALPKAFESMPFGGFLANIFFTLLFFAAISSCVAGVQVIKTVVREKFNLTHFRATIVSFLPVLFLGIFSAISFTSVPLELFGRPFLEVLDLFAANQTVVISGVVGGAIIAWKISKSDLNEGFGFKWRKLAWFTVSIVRWLPIPVVVLLIVTWLI